MQPDFVDQRVAGHYERLVAVAFVATPAELGRHSRVLLAHAIVQELPTRQSDEPTSEEDLVIGLFAAAVRDALDPRPRRVRPAVRGLRFFPVSDAVETLEFERGFQSYRPAVRAAWALQHLAGFDDAAASRILIAAGLPSAHTVMAEARQIPDHPAPALFDPCTVRLVPARSRRTPRWWLAPALVATALVVLLAFVAWPADESEPGSERVPLADVSASASGSAFPTAARARWRTTTKLDFTAWPARGDRVDDTGLLRRAWRTWQDGRQVTVSAGTSPSVPSELPAVLFAATVDGASVVVFHDGQRVARFTEQSNRAAVHLQRVDGPDLVTAAALLVHDSGAKRRYLLAPWIATAAVRDVRRPGASPRTLAVAGGLTAPVEAGGAGCRSRFALELRSSPAVVEDHAFLVVELGDLVPAHLTFTPPPRYGPSRAPREATSNAALDSWAKHVCALERFRGSGVRAINNWAFAEQNLPVAGPANWACLRADGWSGRGRAVVRLEPRRAPAVDVGAAADPTACSRRSQHLVASIVWRSPAGGYFLLVAGSRHVRQLTWAWQRTTGVAEGPVALAISRPVEPMAVRGRLAGGRVIQAVTGQAARPG